MKQEPESQPGLWGPGQPEPGGPGLPPLPPPLSALPYSLPFRSGLGKQQVIYQASLPPRLPAPPPHLFCWRP
jgi:hypothetical protein